MTYTIAGPLLEVRGLAKRYPGFGLDGVAFSLDSGYIMGLIGRNGAGKTTTLKCVMGLVRPDAGSVRVLGQDFRGNELALKQQIGFALGEVAFYPRSRIGAITDVYRRFYDNWDAAAYRGYLERFELDERKQVAELSAGMRVKYSLALALSHGARLLILDEPTSGLDPVSRDDLLDVFRAIIEDGERSILFSTQITSDLDKCADLITYIAGGRVVAAAETDELLASFRVVRGAKAQLDSARGLLIGAKENDYGFTGLARTADLGQLAGLAQAPATVEDVMIYHERSRAAGGEPVLGEMVLREPDPVILREVAGSSPSMRKTTATGGPSC